MGEIAEYLSKIGRRGGQIGGKAKSKAKVKAARANFKKAVGALRKYPPCTEYTNRSHRFKPVSDLLGMGSTNLIVLRPNGHAGGKRTYWIA